MAVPTVGASLQDVVDEIPGVQTSLQDCIDDSTASYFNGGYYAFPCTSLAEFRGYTTSLYVDVFTTSQIFVPTSSTIYLTAVVSGGISWLWNTGETTQQITRTANSTPGNQTISCTVSNGSTVVVGSVIITTE